MPNEATITGLHDVQGRQGALEGSRPLTNSAGAIITRPNGLAVINTARPMFAGNQQVTVNSVLTRYEWEELDAMVVKEALSRLTAVAALMRRGLTHNLGNIGVMLSLYNKIGELTAAKTTMDGHTRGSRDRLDYAQAGIPVPITHKEFDLATREMVAGQNSGTQLDLTHAGAAARVVGEKLETMLLSGNTEVTFNGNVIYGLTNHPNVNTGSATGDWATAPNAVTTVTNMISSAVGDGMYGPYILLVPATQYTELSTIYISSSDQTQLMRVMEMPQIAEVIMCPTLTAGTILLVQATADVVDMAFVPGYGVTVAEDGIDVTGVTTLEWASGDGMVTYFKTLAVMVPRVKATYSSKSGVVKFTGA